MGVAHWTGGLIGVCGWMASLKAWDGGSHLLWYGGDVVCWGLLVMQSVMRDFCLGSDAGCLIHVVSLGVVLVCKVVIVMGDGRLVRVTWVVVPSMRLCMRLMMSVMDIVVMVR